MPLIILKEVNFNLIMDLFGKSKEEKIAKFKEKQSIRNGKELKKESMMVFLEEEDKQIHMK